MAKSILFVCTGNSCRSIMAEGLLKRYLQDRKRSDIQVYSCGMAAYSGIPPTEYTIRVMKKEEIDVSGYKSAALTKDLINKSDLILVMEEMHKNEVLRLVQEARDKTHLLKEFVKKGADEKNFSVQDPIGRPLEVYERIMAEIKEAVGKLVEKIL